MGLEILSQRIILDLGLVIESQDQTLLASNFGILNTTDIQIHTKIN